MNLSMETPFRITFGILWMVYFGVRLFFQRQIKGQKEYTLINERQEKLLFRLFALAFILLPLYFLTPWIDFASTPLPTWLRWGGGIIVCLGIILFGWAHQALGQNWTAILALSKGHEMVQNGPYRYIRHPMYSAFFVIGIGFGILSANWLIGLTWIGMTVLEVTSRIRLEEALMIEYFGDQYREYIYKTGRLFPKLL